MVTLESGLKLNPFKAFEAGRKYRAWENFYKDILNKGPALTKLIDYLEKVVKSMSLKKIKTNNIFQEFLDLHEEGYVTDLEINDLFLKYISKNTPEGLKGDERNKYQWNTVNNLLRTLKKIKTDEALFLLPYEDKKLTTEFIEQFRFPNIRMRDFYRPVRTNF